MRRVHFLAWFHSFTLVSAFVVAGVATSHAQCVSSKPGNNTIYCDSAGTIIQSPSTAFIDASAFSSSGDICARINAVLTSTTYPYPSQGAVVDARGIGPGTAQFCATNPWAGVTAPSVVLLPSGSIYIQTGWVLPDRTRVMGEGNNPAANGTVIQACPKSGVNSCTATFTGTMIQMCPSGTTQCNGVSVEYVQLDGNSLAINGIVNSNSGPGSYVDHVNLHFIEETGLTVSGVNAEGSGPYSNLACSMGTALGSSGGYISSTACVILDSSFTRGVHGLTCTAVGDGPTAAVYVDSSGNTVENVHFEGVQDGIRIGSSPSSSSTGTAEQGDVIMSINGGQGGDTGPVGNLVHISNSSNAVSDLTVMGLGSATGVTNNLQDDESNTTVATSVSSYTAQYILGQEITSDTYYKFATTPALPSTSPLYPGIPTWITGSLTTTFTAPTTPCPPGAIFSNANSLTASTDGTLFICNGSGTTWTKEN